MLIENLEFRGEEQEPLPKTKILLFQPPLIALSESLGLEVLMGAIRADEELKRQTGICFVDAQIGRMLSSEAVEKIKRENPDILGISVPQYSWDYVREVLRGLKEKYGATQDLPLVLLGGAWPTFVNAKEHPERVFSEFPFVVLVRGEGEEALVEVIKRQIEGRPLAGINNLTYLRDGEVVEELYQPVDLENYVLPDRRGLPPVLERGGVARSEWSRGCLKAEERGPCLFCPRPSVEKYRIVPRATRLEDIITLVDEFGVKKFELADEEAGEFFPELRSIAETIIEAGLDVSFSFSTRPDMILELEEWDATALDLLIQAGLKKVFLGAEGGSDIYLRRLGKGQTVDQVERAIELVLGKNLNFEMGMITFAPRMTFEELKDNLAFLKENDRWQYVPCVSNELNVYEGSLEKLVLEKKGFPLGEFDVNSLRYEVTYPDGKVWQVLLACREWRGRPGHPYDDLYYALKSLVRTKLAPETEMDREIEGFLRGFKKLEFQFLEEVTNLVDRKAGKKEMIGPIEELKRERNSLVSALRERVEEREIVDPRGILYGTIVEFMAGEREKSLITKLGAAAVIIKDGQVLMVVKRELPGKLELPAGTIEKGEDSKSTVVREIREELGVKVEVGEGMPAIIIWNHTDTTGKHFDSLVLLLYKARLQDGVKLKDADGEIVEAVWIKIKDFKEQVRQRGYTADEEVVAFIGSLS